jgi:hypothetical protein
MPIIRKFARSLLLFSAILIAGAVSARAQDSTGRNASHEKEKELLAVLRSDAPAADKAVT